MRQQVLLRAAVPLLSASTGSTAPPPTGRCSRAGAGGGRRRSRPRRSTAMYAATGGLPVLRPGLRQGRLGRRAALADHRRRRAGRRARGRGRAGGRVLRVAVRAGHAGRAGVPAGDGRRRRRGPGRGRRHGPGLDEIESVPTVGGRRAAGPQAAVAVAGARRAAEEGADLLAASAAGSPSPCRTSAGTCGPTAEDVRRDGALRVPRRLCGCRRPGPGGGRRRPAVPARTGTAAARPATAVRTGGRRATAPYRAWP